MRKINKLLMIVMLVFLTVLTSCSSSKYIKKEEYTLTERYEEFEGVKYYYSSVGMIAKEVITDNKEITIYPMINNEPVYSVASNFLKGNSNITTLNLPDSSIIYEKNCIDDCVNLKTINFIESNYSNIELDPICEKNAFNLEDDCYIYIHNIEQIQHYVYAFPSYVNKFKLLSPVELSISLSCGVTGIDNYKTKAKNSSFSVKGKLFGIIDIDVSQSYSMGNGIVVGCHKAVEVIDDVDFFINNKKRIKKQEFDISINTYILVEKQIISGIVTKDYSVSSNKTEKEDRLIGESAWSESKKPGIQVSFKCRFSYVNDLNQD